MRPVRRQSAGVRRRAVRFVNQKSNGQNKQRRTASIDLPCLIDAERGIAGAVADCQAMRRSVHLLPAGVLTGWRWNGR